MAVVFTEMSRPAKNDMTCSFDVECLELQSHFATGGLARGKPRIPHLSPERRRQAVEGIRGKYGLSERLACRIAGQPRGTQRYTTIVRADEDALTQAIIALASQYGPYGYRRIKSLLDDAGWDVGCNRVQRIWRREGLIGNDLDTIQVAGQFFHPLARRVGVGALGRLLKFGADVGDGLEPKGAPGAPHLVPQKLHGLKVNPIQGVQHRDAILPAVLQIRGDPVCEFRLRTHKDRFHPAAFLF
jgi:hypothetical protein